MGRLIRLRPRRASLYALEETIASLHEELQFTLNYAHSMVRDRNYRAAAEVIEEQRRSLVRATKRMEKAVAPEAPVLRKARVRAALVGVAATMALASGAFAAFGPSPKPSAPSRIEAIQQTSLKLIEATRISDPLELQEVLTTANATIAEVAALHPEDHALQMSLLDSVRKLQTVLKQNPNVPASVRARAQEVAEQVKEVVPDSVEEVEEKASETESATETETTAPAAEPSV